MNHTSSADRRHMPGFCCLAWAEDVARPSAWPHYPPQRRPSLGEARHARSGRSPRPRRHPRTQRTRSGRRHDPRRGQFHEARPRQAFSPRSHPEHPRPRPTRPCWHRPTRLEPPGATHGTFAAGSRDDDWDNAGQNDELAANWGGLVANWGWNWSAVVNTDWQALLDSAFAGGGGRPEGHRCGRRSGRPRLDRMECLKRPGFCRGSVRTHRRRRLLGTIAGGFGPLLLKGPTMGG